MNGACDVLCSDDDQGWFIELHGVAIGACDDSSFVEEPHAVSEAEVVLVVEDVSGGAFNADGEALHEYPLVGVCF